MADRRLYVPQSDRRLLVMDGPIVLAGLDGAIELPRGNPARLAGLVVAHGGSLSIEQLSEHLWPGDDNPNPTRVRNILLRLTRGAGQVVVRAGSGVRLAPNVGCDLVDFDRLASEALSMVGTNPGVACDLAARAVGMTKGDVLSDFEYEEWAIAVRHSINQKLNDLLDLLANGPTI